MLSRWGAKKYHDCLTLHLKRNRPSHWLSNKPLTANGTTAVADADTGAPVKTIGATHTRVYQNKQFIEKNRIFRY